MHLSSFSINVPLLLSLIALMLTPFAYGIEATDSTRHFQPSADSGVSPNVNTSPISGCIAQTPPVDTVTRDSSAASDLRVRIEGVILDTISGGYPVDDSLLVTVDSIPVVPDSTGSFSFATDTRPLHRIVIISKKFDPLTLLIQELAGKRYYFVTALLRKVEENIRPAETVNSSVDWTINGCITDSRFDVAIKHDSIKLTFDDIPVMVTRQGKFKVVVDTSGLHTFHLVIPGYHEVYEQVELLPTERDIFQVLQTTELGFSHRRRQITVTARREPLHTVSEVAKTTINRVELERAAATLNDPVRLFHTLPGVTSENDAASRPVVRGGDLQECRIYLDNIPLLVPYHFGGAKSTFNQAAVSSISLYKSGFPAQFHNAQAAIIAAQSRIPNEDSVAITFDWNPFQYELYAGLPFFDRKAAFFGALQGSYFDFVYKRILDVMASSAGPSDQNEIRDLKKMTNMPDYKDYAAGFSFSPNPSLRFCVNDIFNTDNFVFTESDSMVPITYYYHKYYYRDQSDGQIHWRNGPDNSIPGLRDTSIAYTIHMNTSEFPPIPMVLDKKLEQSRPNLFALDRMDPLNDYQRAIMGRNYYTIDTIIHYKSFYNILYGTGRFVPSSHQTWVGSIAWQKRWWDLVIPRFTDMEMNKWMRYDVTLDQCNGSAGWIYTGKEDHLLQSGIQFDYTHANYDVDISRLLHEIIINGNTNIGEVWGPASGDVGMNISLDEKSPNTFWNIGELYDRVFYTYKGKKGYLNGSLFCSDEWNYSPDLRFTIGGRLEGSSADRSVQMSPRLSAHYRIDEARELVGSAGLYTQNNYDISTIALSKKLKPEKVWHSSIGFDQRLLSWLNQNLSLYGKYYYDLTSERIASPEVSPTEFLNFLKSFFGDHFIDSLESVSPQRLMDLMAAFKLETFYQSASYTSDGRGFAAGLEYFLRYDPTDYWNGWISVTLSRSRRQRHPGWRWHDFPFDRPLMISLVNYYRLARGYEISMKYRFMSGIPYTETNIRPNGVYIGPFNDKRYAPYHRIDLRISHAFKIGNFRGSTYLETWNAMNAPNMFLRDNKTNKFVTSGINLPTAAVFFGINGSL